jgi:hypothetical protein
VRADAFGQERVAGFLCLGPHSYVRFKPHMLAGVPQLWFQPVVAAPRLGPWALGTDRLARHLLRGSTATAESITEEDLAVFTTRLHEQGHPEAGSALYRKPHPSREGRFFTAAYRKPRLTVPTWRCWAAPMRGSGQGCSTSPATRRTTSSATSSTARGTSSQMTGRTRS